MRMDGVLPLLLYDAGCRACSKVMHLFFCSLTSMMNVLFFGLMFKGNAWGIKYIEIFLHNLVSAYNVTPI